LSSIYLYSAAFLVKSGAGDFNYDLSRSLASKMIAARLCRCTGFWFDGFRLWVLRCKYSIHWRSLPFLDGESRIPRSVCCCVATPLPLLWAINASCEWARALSLWSLYRTHYYQCRRHPCVAFTSSSVWFFFCRVEAKTVRLLPRSDDAVNIHKYLKVAWHHMSLCGFSHLAVQGFYTTYAAGISILAVSRPVFIKQAQNGSGGLYSTHGASA